MNRTAMHLPSIWNGPYERNPFFTGREDALSQLHVSLNVGRTTATAQPRGLSDLGGMGKMQIAIEYAYRYHGEYHRCVSQVKVNYAR